jgi:radical SAM superfamily enzyme YgiQ (UPF0313 family)
VRPPYDTGLTRAVRLVTEPLDLEYLAAVAGQAGWTWRMHDPVATGERLSEAFRAFEPDVVAITGYYPARDAMLAIARAAKTWRADTRVVIGGVHAELNPKDFQGPAVDAIVYVGGALTFGRWLAAPREAAVPGTWQTAPGSGGGHWVCQPPPDPADVDVTRLPLPDRTHLQQHRHAFSYLHYGPVALVKSAFGCPHDCNFCYCRLLNGGRYAPRPVEDVAAEIAGVDGDLIWLVDDTFLAQRTRPAALADALERRGVRKRYIVYARASDIAGTPAVVSDLGRLGVIDVLVGLETVDAQHLAAWEKGTTVDDNRRCVELLAAAGIACTGLFIVEPGATRSTFRELNRWIDSVPLSAVTVSIFTPFPGAPGWERFAPQLTTRDCRKWDLCHLVLPPHLPRWLFYALFGWTHLRALPRNPALMRHALGGFVRRRRKP